MVASAGIVGTFPAAGAATIDTVAEPVGVVPDTPVMLIVFVPGELYKHRNRMLLFGKSYTRS